MPDFTGLEGQGAEKMPKRPLWDAETGERREVYHIDAREYLKQKLPDGSAAWVTSPKLLSKKVRGKKAAKQDEEIAKKSAAAQAAARREAADKAKREEEEAEAARKAGESEEDEEEQEQEEEQEEEQQAGATLEPAANLATWDDWSDDQLLALAKDLKVRDHKKMTREQLIAAAEDKGAEPADEKPAA